MGLDKVNEQIQSIRTTLEDTQKQQVELKQAVIFTQTQQEEMKAQLDQMKMVNKNLVDRIHFAENRTIALEKQLEICKQNILDNQSHSMENNLIFYGINETTNENTNRILFSFLKNEMKIPQECFNLDTTVNESDADKNIIWIQRVHRFGQTGIKGNPRPIIAKLICGKECIIGHAKNLAGTKYFVSVQMPPELSERKKKVAKIFKSSRQDGKKPRYDRRGDSVIVDKRKYQAPSVPLCTATPSDIMTRQMHMGITSSKAVDDKGNRFIAHMAAITSVSDIPVALSAIKNRHYSIASATHNMFAVRATNGTAVQEYSDDDGEYGLSQEILKVLQLYNVTNRLVVVTRWASGIQLGRKRYSIVRQCTEDILRNNNLIPLVQTYVQGNQSPVSPNQSNPRVSTPGYISPVTPHQPMSFGSQQSELSTPCHSMSVASGQAVPTVFQPAKPAVSMVPVTGAPANLNSATPTFNHSGHTTVCIN